MENKLSASDSKVTLLKFFEEEEKQSPSFRFLSQVPHSHENLSPTCGTHLLSDLGSPSQAQSPESIWSSTPVCTPSHPSLELVYKCISSLRREGDLYSIAVSGDQQVVLTGSCSRRIHAWQAEDCHAKGYIHASSGQVRAMVAHGEVLFTSHKDHKIRIWNLKHTNNNSNNFSPKKIITLPNGTNNATRYFKNLITRPIITTPQLKPIIRPLHKDIISCMAYYHDEGILYTGSFDTTVNAWRVNQKKCVDSFIAHAGNIHDMVVNQQNGHLFTCSSDGTVKMWIRVLGENTHSLIIVLTFHAYPVYALALSTSNVSSSKDSFLYAGSSDGCINLWEQQHSCRYAHGGFFQGHKFAVHCLVTLEDLLISGSEDSTIRIWRREKAGGCHHECLATIEGHKGPVRCLNAVLQNDNKLFEQLCFLVYSASNLDHTFKVWRVKLLPTKFSNNQCNNRKTTEPFEDYDDYDHHHVIDDDDNDTDHTHHLKSPVLSPPWVKKKLQCRSLVS